MELKLKNSQKKLELADNIFACDFNEPLIHQIVIAYMAAGRAGTKAQKTRAENLTVKKGRVVLAQEQFVALSGVKVVLFLLLNQEVLNKK
jgi:hypothetical protein